MSEESERAITTGLMRTLWRLSDQDAGDYKLNDEGQSRVEELARLGLVRPFDDDPGKPWRVTDRGELMIQAFIAGQCEERDRSDVVAIGAVLRKVRLEGGGCYVSFRMDRDAGSRLVGKLNRYGTTMRVSFKGGFGALC